MTAPIEEPIRCEVLVCAAPEAAYDAIATAAGLDAWFTAGASVDARPGGEIRFRWKDWGPAKVDAEDGGPVLEARRPERFVFQWSPDGPEYRTTVEVDFDRVPEGTVVRVREHGWRDTPSARRRMLDCACGWGEALALLKFHVEHGPRHATDTPQFLYRLRPTRVAMLAEGPGAREAEILGRHFAYLKRLCDEGVVELAGRTLEGDERTFGLVVLRAASEAQARSLMQSDPAVKEGVMSAELFPFRIALP